MPLAEVEFPIEPSHPVALQWKEPVRHLAAGPSVTGSGPLAMLETAAKRARGERTLEFAAEALQAAAALAAHEGGRYRHIAQLEAMRLRTEFIAELGSRAGHSVLDREIVLRWFIEELPFTADVAQSKIARMDGDQLVEAEEFRMLRQIKSRLTFVQQLAACGELPQDRELAEWLELYNLLP